MRVKYLLIGAGPTALGAAYRLQELGEQNFLILEANPWVGGLASSFVDEMGFTWDIGGHVQFSHYKYFDQVMDRALGEDGWLQHQRESWVWIKDRFLPYPFQNNVRYLPKDAAWQCLKGVIEANVKPLNGKPENFKEWIIATFGEGIATEFMLPYNFKVWAYPPEQLDYSWIGERVSVVDMYRVAENIVLEKDDVSWGPNNLFRFPKHGGTGAIWRSVGKIIGDQKISLSSAVSKVHVDRGSVELSDGRSFSYDNLLSTIPLDQFALLVEDLPHTLKTRANGLVHSSSNIVGVGLRGQPKEELATKCWMYFPESNCPFYRVTLFSKYSPYNVPDSSKFFSLMTETSESSAKPVNSSSLVRETVQGLLNTKLIRSENDVVSTWSYRAEYGYPTPSLERDAILKDVMPVLETRGLFSRGRFGGWKYEVSNQDHSFMQGVEWVNRMERGETETTFSY